MIIKKKNFKKVALFALVSLISSLMNILITFLISLFYNPDEFSSFYIYMSYALLLINIIMLGSGNIIAAFKEEINSFENKYLYLWISIIFPAVSAIFLVIYSIIKSFLITSISLIDIVGILFFVSGSCSIQLIKSSYLINYKFTQIFKILFFLLIFSILVLYGLNYYSIPLVRYFLILGIIYQITPILILNQKIDLKLFTRINFKSHLSFGLPSAINSTAMSFLSNGDKLLIPFLFNDNYFVSTYLYASLIAGYSLFIVNIYASYWGAEITNLWLNHKVEQKIKLFKKQKSLIFWIFLPLFFLPLAWVYSYFVIIDDFYMYFVVCFILLIGHLFSGVNKFYLGFILMFKNSKYNLISSVYAGIIFSIIVISLKDIFGLYSLAIGLLTASIFLTLRSFLFVRTKILTLV